MRLPATLGLFESLRGMPSIIDDRLWSGYTIVYNAGPVAGLELVAVFERDENGRFPAHLGKVDTEPPA